MGIFDMFTSAPAATPDPAATPAPAPGGQGGIPATPEVPGATPTDGTATNGVVPGTPVTSAEPAEPDSPLAEWSKLWDTKPNEGDANAAPEQIDPAKLQEVINKADFSTQITPEIQAKIAAGGEEALAATLQAMNSVGQSVMMQSTLAANKMIEGAVAKAIEAQSSNLPEMLRQQNLTNSLKDANPVFSNPAVKPVIDAVATQLRGQFPQASTTELTAMAEKFALTMGEALSPGAVTTTGADGVPADQDFSNFLELPQN